MAHLRHGRGQASLEYVGLLALLAVALGVALAVTGGVGLRLSPLRLNAAVSGTAGVAFTAGRTWDLPTVEAAAAFIKRYAAGRSLGGEARQLGHDLCFLCPGWLRGRGRPRLPPPSSRSIEGGVFANATAALGLAQRGGYPVSADPSVGAVLGRQTAGSRTTWYVRVDASLLVHLGPVLSP